MTSIIRAQESSFVMVMKPTGNAIKIVWLIRGGMALS